ncbi:MAG: helix-turn-helix transcriptional regulator [Gammaproteobacteria bacterium]|nr:helix-turn-helix transcriptional regulator [Gammaproteobacteria bacterium]
MNQVEIFKALANESRLQILQWLKDPQRHFAPGAGEPCMQSMGIKGACVGTIQKKLGLSQSTVSHYLAILEQAELVVAKRQGQWTYYERNEETLKALGRFLKEDI